MTAHHYKAPRSSWVHYEFAEVAEALVNAKAAVAALRAIPHQRDWADRLQELELKREVAGTSRIEGAEFTDTEFEEAIKESPQQLRTRSQKQAQAAIRTYRWIAQLPDDRPLDGALIQEIHQLMVEGADDDHCPPGQLRPDGHNVTFGIPFHRGAEGGRECSEAFDTLTKAIAGEFRGHDPIIGAIAAHYHLAAIHPFADGNGRTARAVEALMLRRSGLRNTTFIAMSNYYHEEKVAYLEALHQTYVEERLTPFINFCLKGLALQCERVLDAVRREVSKAIFINLMHDLYNRLQSPKKRVIAKRQRKILELLLEEDELPANALLRRTEHLYAPLKNQRKAILRDLSTLMDLGAIQVSEPADKGLCFSVRLDWPSEITQTKFFEVLKMLPKTKEFERLLK